MKKSIYTTLVLPCFILVTVVLIVPIVMIVIPSFTEGGLSLTHYITFLSDPFYQGILWRTLKLSVITTLICALFGIPTAYFISIQKKSVKSLLQALVMFPLLTNAVVRGFAWMNVLGRNGLINKFLMSLSLIEEPLSLMYTELAIMVGSVYLFLPLMITTLTSVMENIDSDLVNATLSLGAKPYQVFFKVIIPLCFSGILVGSVLVFTGTLSAYTTPSLLGGNQNMMLATLLYQQANQLSNWTNAGMISLIMIVLSLTVMKGMNRLSKRLDKRGYEHA